MNIADLRKDYTLQALDESHVSADPLRQFAHWFDEAIRSEVLEPNAMTLSTVSADGRPSGRIVLLKGLEEGEFVFFTNYQSRKGQDLSVNPWASLTFFWAELERQVRIEGRVTPLSEERSTAYFQSRPAGSQLGAWASPQSQIIDGRAFLEHRLEAITLLYGQSSPIPKPAHWGGYALRPDYLEFWQGRPSRMHDRISYQWAEEQWRIMRLAP